jgi:hypothetical protein
MRSTVICIVKYIFYQRNFHCDGLVNLSQSKLSFHLMPVIGTDDLAEFIFGWTIRSTRVRALDCTGTRGRQSKGRSH